MEGQCFKCREKTTIKDPQIIQSKNKRSRVTGTCEKCGTKISKFIKAPNVEAKIDLIEKAQENIEEHDLQST